LKIAELNDIKEKIFHSEEFKELAQRAKALEVGQSLALGGVAGSMLAFVAARVYEQRPLLLVASDEDRAEKLRDDCSLLVGEQNVRFFGARPTHQAQALDMTSSIAQIETLKALTTGTRLVVVASPESIAEKVPLPKQFTKNIVELKAGNEYKFQELIARLEGMGFEQKEFVESYGDIAVRGGIIDVFPYVGENPIRFEFWGDTIESIREFDVLSQRSIRELQSASIVPAMSTDISDSSDSSQIADSADKNLSGSLFDYLQQDACVILDEPSVIEHRIDELSSYGNASLFKYDDIVRRCAEFSIIISSALKSELPHVPFPPEAGKHPTPHISIGSFSQPAFNGSINALLDSLEKFSNENYTLYLTSDVKAESERLKELIEEAVTSPDEVTGSGFEDREKYDELEPEELNPQSSNLKPLSDKNDSPQISNRHIEYLTETLHSGFVFHPAKLVVFTEHEIFNRLKRRGLPKRRRFKGFSQKELSQLKRGNYVVHVDHGIGVFDGLKKIKVGGTEQEVMKVLFLENDVLYVNLSFINRVQKYSSQEGHVPHLGKLGSPDWDRAKAKAKKRIKDIARDLMTLYARRKNDQGFGFSPDTHWQKELEASFMYEDTPDQASATLAVKQDMEGSSPMDRLICGDVGFGKTEIAVRAAFKAVMDGKQVGILVPTTILAIQHYNTFQDRLARYTTKIEHITRFKSKKEQQTIVDALSKGSLDIIIGTHRLLSKDIVFKDLGLLIIDEEHRFGVTAKEKLRQLKATVDTLTLTATPIPRTLHFSLMGARDLSLINTPPRNRLPIVTEIIVASEGRQSQWRVIREAIVKELHRGGQVYVVHDRVQNIDAIVDQVRAHVPEARVHVAHGQMSGHELEKTMLDFLEKKYDVLVATKIIESGLDIPSVNTIVINRADRFGLAELYQLRGRVGRSNVQAYAYLLVPPLSVLPKQTLRRLQAIEEFTELGSGFNLAMRDLEIRGAGNIFGAEQSGFIMEMGFEMYERIVREAVEELKQEEFKGTFQFQKSETAGSQSMLVETIIDSDIEALIPDVYIESDTERLDVYRRLYRAVAKEDLQIMRDELQDRFGEYPQEVEHLFRLVELRLTAARGGFPKVSLKDQLLTITLPDSSNEKFYGKEADMDAPFQRIVKRLADGAMSNTRLHQQGKELMLQIRLTGVSSSQDRLGEAQKKINELSKLMVIDGQ
jgi:transcription-repair coupling factor (superfamily II helicase)